VYFLPVRHFCIGVACETEKTGNYVCFKHLRLV
jgi:hypothetical protein